MSDFLKQKEITDDDLVFADEDYGEQAIIEEKRTWKILIADDEEEVHNVTKMVLEDYRFEGRSLAFLQPRSRRLSRCTHAPGRRRLPPVHRHNRTRPGRKLC